MRSVGSVQQPNYLSGLEVKRKTDNKQETKENTKMEQTEQRLTDDQNTNIYTIPSRHCRSSVTLSRFLLWFLPMVSVPHSEHVNVCTRIKESTHVSVRLEQMKYENNVNSWEEMANTMMDISIRTHAWRRFNLESKLKLLVSSYVSVQGARRRSDRSFLCVWLHYEHIHGVAASSPLLPCSNLQPPVCQTSLSLCKAN